MTLSIHFVQDCPAVIWGLTARERMTRVLAAAGVTDVAEDLGALREGDRVLMLRGDYLVDDRLLQYLASTPGVMLQVGRGASSAMVAAHVPAGLAGEALSAVAGGKTAAPLPGVRVQTLDDLSISFQEKLRKFDPPFVLPVSERVRGDIERTLFDWSYKGVTDLVTKWAWPLPARWAVRQCVRLGIQPNHVTLASLVLVILAGLLFAWGHFAWGLAAAWLMTFLDTVDGKLARVTVTSSPFGHYFDHLIDLFSPPIWYLLWGIGLAAADPAGHFYSLRGVLWLIIGGYVAGRLAELGFKRLLGRFGIFCWRPVDAYIRLVTARRNPNLILLTAFTLGGRPDLGLLAVMFWTVVTSVVLVLRLLYAGYVRAGEGPLRSWFTQARNPRYAGSLAVRLFTRDFSG